MKAKDLIRATVQRAIQKASPDTPVWDAKHGWTTAAIVRRTKKAKK